MFRYFSKICPENSITLTSDTKNAYFTWRSSIYVLFIVFRSVLFIVRNVSHEFVEKIKTQISCSITFYTVVAFMKWCGKIFYSRTGNRWQSDESALHTRYWRLQTHTQNIYYSFSTATMFTFTRLNVMLYANWPSCYFIFTKSNVQVISLI